MDNTSITVATFYDCDERYSDKLEKHVFNPSWRHNMIGCCLMAAFQELYKLNMTYVIKTTKELNATVSPDLYAFPLTTQTGILEYASPVDGIALWRFGFILRRSHDFKIFRNYYTKPFTSKTWDCIVAMAVFVAIFFFLVRWWEKRLLGGASECSFGHEVLLTIGGYCQHIFPVEIMFSSRRTAYFTFFLYCYIIYTVYTSNLLSHLVNDKENNMQLADLRANDYELVTFAHMKHILAYEYSLHIKRDVRFYDDLTRMKTMGVHDALQAVMINKTALLSDYTTIYPIVKRIFDDTQINDLIEIDLTPKVKKYIFASKTFRYTEQLRLTILRVKETGVLARLLYMDKNQILKCDSTALRLEVRLPHIMTPLLMLFSTYLLSTIILIVERVHYKRNRLWPYME